jgi:hypothetical protein
MPYAIQMENAFRNAMGDYTTRTCADVYRNVYVNSNERKLCEEDKALLDEIFKRSGRYSKSPFIFGWFIDRLEDNTNEYVVEFLRYNWKNGAIKLNDHKKYFENDTTPTVDYSKVENPQELIKQKQDIAFAKKMNEITQNYKIEKKIETKLEDKNTDTNTITTTMATYTTTIITAEQYKNGIQKETGTLMFGDKYYDMLSYMDMKVLRKKFGMRKEQRIKAVVVMTKEHTEFKNVANLDLPLKYAVFCDKDDVGAEWANFGGMYSHKHPLGDAFVVVNKL